MNEDDILILDGEDPEMVETYKRARSTFKYYWRELSWERRRIIPGLAMSAVKVGFKNDGEEGPSQEHMWLTDVDFDGETLTATLMNQPQWVTHLKPEDRVSFKFSEISDWMYTINGHVYGAYTVNFIRSKMVSDEMAAHDDAWGLDFGDPHEIEIFYKEKPKKSLLSFFKKSEQVTDQQMMQQEHPMCLNMGDSLREQLQQSKELIQYVDEHGNTMLHSEALAGNAKVVEILLEFGADPNLENKNGQKPLDLARVLEWDNVERVLGS